MQCIHPNGKILVVIEEGNRFNNYETEYDRRDCGCNINNKSEEIKSTNLGIKCPRCTSIYYYTRNKSCFLEVITRRTRKRKSRVLCYGRM